MKYLLIFLFSSLLYSQSKLTPLEKNDYKKITSHTKLIEFVESVAANNPAIKIEYIAESVEGRKIPALKISNTDFGKDDSKIKILIFAQQHGNEQSGKEGALLLLKKIAEGKLNHLLSKIDLILVPQMNPDGSEKNQRRNGNNMDLNRNHLILTEPETIGLHKIFNPYLPEMTLDVHEYFPFTDDWQKFGYIKYWDEQFGTTTNPNVSEEIRDYSVQTFLPYAKNFLNERGFTFNNYILGGPPTMARMRHSTFDINDGRQSMGIQNSFSFILEGLNGEDAFVDNIKRRAEGQAAALEAFLQFAFENSDEIKKLVKKEREELLNSSEGEMIAIQMEHVKGKEPLVFKLRPIYSKQDSQITVEEYHNDFEKILEVEKPAGYLIPKSNEKLKQWLDKHSITYDDYSSEQNDKIISYHISGMDSIYLEELQIGNPVLGTKTMININEEDFLFVRVNQLKSNMLVLALEPKSMLGLRLYDYFKELIEVGKDYPVMKVLRKD